MRVIFFKKEKELLSRIRSGDERAMESVYTNYRNDFIRWSKAKYSISANDSLDHYQDTVTIFFEKVMNGTLTEIESTIKTYLFGIGKNRIKQRIDSEIRKEQHTAALVEHYRFLAENDEMIETFNAAQEATRRVFDSIGEPCKTILKLFYFEKKVMTEIAKEMGHKSEAVSRTTKKRCLEKIRSSVLLKSNDDG
ncbi:MAG: sigma-70 family RNA polymerase sigma factor [Bacteroidetes bacterium]|nr:sigma-70 family RNA polymerase sigma factor [Bacteroidota bacterium]